MPLFRTFNQWTCQHCADSVCFGRSSYFHCLNFDQQNLFVNLTTLFWSIAFAENWNISTWAQKLLTEECAIARLCIHKVDAYFSHWPEVSFGQSDWTHVLLVTVYHGHDFWLPTPFPCCRSTLIADSRRCYISGLHRHTTSKCHANPGGWKEPEERAQVWCMSRRYNRTRWITLPFAGHK